MTCDTDRISPLINQFRGLKSTNITTENENNTFFELAIMKFLYHVYQVQAVSCFYPTTYNDRRARARDN